MNYHYKNLCVCVLDKNVFVYVRMHPDISRYNIYPKLWILCIDFDVSTCTERNIVHIQHSRTVFVLGYQNKSVRDTCVELEYVNDESSVNTCRNMFAKVTLRSGRKRKSALQGLSVRLSNTRR